MNLEQIETDPDLLEAKLKELNEAEEFKIGEPVEFTADGRLGKVIETNNPNLPLDKQLPYNTVRVKFADGASLLCQKNHLKKIGNEAEKGETTNKAA